MARQQGRDRASAISYNQLLVLQALSTGCRYGLEVMTATELSAGTVYPILRRFEAEGLVSSSREDESDAHADGRPARRLNKLTARGRSALAGAREEFLARQRALGLLPPA